MKPVIIPVIAAAAALAASVPAFANPGPGPEVEIEHTVARVAVVVEDRTDIAVEIEQGSSGLPAIRVTRDGANVRIDGGLRRRGMFAGDHIRNCRSGPAGGQPGDGASVEVRNVGRVNLSDAPLVVVRTSRNVTVGASGAVFGSVGRGAASVDLSNGGCGNWNVANTDGSMSLRVSGSGDIRAGTSSALDVSVSGAGTVSAGATRSLEVSVSGAGNVVVARVDGPADIGVSGAGDVDVRAGAAPNLSISVSGVGDVDFAGEARDVDVAISGAGNVRIARATGSVDRSVSGVGNIRIGD